MATMKLLEKKQVIMDDISVEREVARKYSLSDVTSDSDALNVNKNIVGEKPCHHGPFSLDQRGVARKYSLSEVTSD